MSSDAASPAPVVTRDPRFGAGRKLVTSGTPSEAVEMFAMLLEETRHKYGDASIESAPAYYEYGNALLRTALRNMPVDGADGSEGEDPSRQTEDDVKEIRENAAAAALARQQHKQEHDDQGKHAAPQQRAKQNEEDAKPAAKPSKVGSSDETKLTSNSKSGIKSEMNGELQTESSNAQAATPVVDIVSSNSNSSNKSTTENRDKISQGDGDDEDGGVTDDLNLALEMMENAFSILDEQQQQQEEEDKEKEEASTKYDAWVAQQLPRVLLGIGDVLSSLQRHADAADVYSRALEIRETELEHCKTAEGAAKSPSVAILRAHRRIAEAAVLIAEELLACPPSQDVVTTETNTLIVKAGERVEYARGYYDKARDALQEAVFTMGIIASGNADEVATEKEDVCFIATMIMGVGTTLAEIDEQNDAATQQESLEPTKKKTKR